MIKFIIGINNISGLLKLNLKTKHTYMLLLFALFQIHASAQDYITGKVTDYEGNPLFGATILLKGTTNGVNSDFDGNYKIELKENTTTLSVSYVGYKTKNIQIADKKIIDIQLEQSVESLDETVVIGYGKVKRENLTGSVATIEIKNISNQAPTVNLDDALQGQVAGVQVTNFSGQPGAASNIRIRGVTSLTGNNQPLYVIDGIPIAPNSNITTTGGFNNLNDNLNKQGISTPIGNISPLDIESISVLKDASAAAIYGSRAANGVIIINTKRGTYGAKTTFNANSAVSTQVKERLPVLNAAQYKKVWTTAVNNAIAGKEEGVLKTLFLKNNTVKTILDGSYFGDADTNWENEVSPKLPITTTYNISVRGGSEKMRYSVSLGANSQDAIYKNSGFDRYSSNLNLDTKIRDFWTFGGNINLSFSDQSSLIPGIANIISTFRPDLSVYDEDGNYTYSGKQENPIAMTEGYSINKTSLLLGSLYTNIQIIEGLSFNTLFSFTQNRGDNKSFAPGFIQAGGYGASNSPPFEGNGFAQQSATESTKTLLQSTLTYDKAIKNHNINAVLGISFEKNKNFALRGWGKGILNKTLSNLTSATEFTDSASNEGNSGLASYFGRSNYDYNNKYLATLSGRVDGSSKFGKDNQYAFFPAVAVAWRISNEEFLNDVSFIDELKLRTSFGITGQQDFANYAWRTLFESDNYGPEPATKVSSLGNNILKWETTEQTDFGIDFSFFKGRLSGGFGYYSKLTKDALYGIGLPGSTGYGSITTNIGNTKNVGFELELRGNIIKTNDFSWNVSLNMSQNRNTLVKISDDLKDDNGFIAGYAGGTLKEGSPIGLMIGYESDGLYQSQEEIDALNKASPTGVYTHKETAPGDIKFKDVSGPDGVPDGRITNEDGRQIIGDTQPDLFGGINSTWSYKGFSLSTFFNFTIGNDIYASSLANRSNFGTGGENKITTVLDAWTPENTNTSVPRSVYGDPNRNYLRKSSHYVYDASFVRLKTLSINYTLQKKMIERIKFINSLSVYMVAQNLLTFKIYPGSNPQGSNVFGNDISSGLDVGGIPISKTFTAGIKLGF